MMRSGRGTGPPGRIALKPRMAAATSGGAALALHRDRPDEHRPREPLAQPVQDVADDRARGRGDDPDHLRQVGQGALPRRLEQPFRRQRLLARLEHRHQRPDPGGRDLVDDELVLRGRREGGQPAGGDDLHPLLRLHPQRARRAAEGDRAEGGVRVLEVEIEVPRGVARDAPDLAAHPHPAELALDHPLHRPGDLRDGELGRVRPGARVLEELHPRHDRPARPPPPAVAPVPDGDHRRCRSAAGGRASRVRRGGRARMESDGRAAPPVASALTRSSERPGRSSASACRAEASRAKGPLGRSRVPPALTLRSPALPGIRVVHALCMMCASNEIALTIVPERFPPPHRPGPRDAPCDPRPPP